MLQKARQRRRRRINMLENGIFAFVENWKVRERLGHARRQGWSLVRDVTILKTHLMYVFHAS